MEAPSVTDVPAVISHHKSFRQPAQDEFWFRPIAAYCLMLLSCGCTSWRDYFANGFKVGPNYCPPPAPVADHWIDAADYRVRSTHEEQPRWWTVFNDPVLDSLVETGYRQNLGLRQATYRVLQARAQLGIAIGNFFPQTQQMTGDAYREAISRNSANRAFVGTRYYNQLDYGFNLAWELDFWGRLRRAIESADENMNVSVEDYDAVLVTLLGDVAANYVQYRTIAQQIKYTNENIDLQSKSLVLAEARFKAGATSDLDTEQARTVLAQTKAQIPFLEINLRQTANRLCTLMGMPPEDLTARLGPGEIPTAPPDVAAGIPADLLRRRPDVMKAEHAAAAQSAQIGIAAAEFYPHISLIGTVDYQSQSIRNLLAPGSFQGTVGPSFQWNILNYGRILNNVRAQDALLQQLVVAYQNAVLNGAYEVENGLITFLKSHQQSEFQNQAVEAAKKAVEIAVVQYREGRVDFNRVAVLQQNLVNEQNLLAQARGQIATGLVNVYRALGGGWEIRLESDGLNVDDHMRVMPFIPVSPVPASTSGVSSLIDDETPPPPSTTDDD